MARFSSSCPSRSTATPRTVVEPPWTRPVLSFPHSGDTAHEGVYAVAVDGDVAYVGRCQNLSERFNERGYGTIHPRNCFEQGQGTNCKINHLILESAKRGRRIDLWFHRSADPDRFEKQLISELSPTWNAQGKVAIRKRLKIDSERKTQANLVSQDSPAPAGMGGIVPVFSLTL